MRRISSYIGIALLTLLVNGWGVALAAALCPHGGGHQHAAMSEDHSCCLFKIDKPEKHGSHHQPSPGAKKVVVECGKHNSATALSQRAESCAHCVSQSNPPATLARARELSVKKVDAHVEQPCVLFVAPAGNFAPQFIPTEHSPPLASNRKHLLLNVFLI